VLHSSAVSRLIHNKPAIQVWMMLSKDINSQGTSLAEHGRVWELVLMIKANYIFHSR